MNRLPARMVVLLLAQESAARADHRYLISACALRQWVCRGHVKHHADGYDLMEVLAYVSTKRKIENYPRRVAA